MNPSSSQPLPETADAPGSPELGLPERPLLRPDLVISAREERGVPEYVVKLPEQGRYFRVGESEYLIMQLMDGQHDLEQIRQASQNRHDLTVELSVLEGFVGGLAKNGCLDQDTADEDGKASKRVGVKGLFSKLLYFRVSLIDPDGFLSRLEPHLRFFYTRAFGALVALLVTTAIITLIANSQAFVHEAASLGSVSGVAVLWLMAACVVALHEMAHGLTCKHFGGHIPTMGILIILLSFPCFYTDVSDAWLFREKRQRLWVTFAGVFFEGFLWSLAILVWRVTEPSVLVHQLALGVCVSSGFGMLLSLNPLLKFDGYYLLGDGLGIPNMRDRSLSYLMLRLAGWTRREKQLTLSVGKRERRIYGLYGVFALAYTVVVLGGLSVGIGLLLVRALGLVGLVLAAGVCWLLLKAIFGGLAKARRQSILSLGVDRSHTHRSRALPVALAAAAAVIVVGSALVPMDQEVTGAFTVQPWSRRLLAPEVSGMVTEVAVSQGQRVSAGDLLVRLDPARHRANLAEARAALRQEEEALGLAQRGPRAEQMAVARAQITLSRSQQDHARIELDRGMELFSRGLMSAAVLDARRHSYSVATGHYEIAQRRADLLEAGSGAEEIAQRQAQVEEFSSRAAQAARDLEATTVRAPLDGTIITANPQRLLGTLVQPSTQMLVLHVSAPTAIVSVEEQEIETVRADQTVRLKATSFPERTFVGRVRAISPVAAPDVAHGFWAPVVKVRLGLEDPEDLLRVGMTGQARIHCGEGSALSLAVRRVRRWVNSSLW
jgi:putative peptide zinc metalloprotease protein